MRAHHPSVEIRVRAESPWPVRRSRRYLPFGLIALALPWLFASPRPVVALAAAVVIGLRLIKGSDRLSARDGYALDVQRRDSHDEIWFVGGVCLAYLWSAAEPLNYCIAILVLVLADLAASLVRTRFGEMPNASSDERNGATGSLAFFLTAFVVAWSALLVASTLRPLESLAAAALVATITTGLEASLSDGLQLMFVPIGALVALELAMP
jgi:phytol kinase